ncbi:MAG TPA: SUKH-3 domain-containing protein [Pseudonocardiaceae bacterium]|nr:SUKH-3 domain-containing protein [Pseudonocardiaceae bacterium]
MTTDALWSDTRDMLREAGWYPGRGVDIASFVATWDVSAIPHPAAVTDFVREFAGLTVHHPPTIVINGVTHTDWTELDPVKATLGVSDRMLFEYGRIAGSQLCPCGTNRSHMTLLMAGTGQVFGGVDNYLVRFGSTVPDALNLICSVRAPKKVGEWHV